MALVSGVRSSLNPDAPLFIPAAYRQVEDFSPEWWQLVTTSTWYRDYWLTQHQDDEGVYDDDVFDDGDVVGLLPDAFDFDAADDLEVQFEDLVKSSEAEVESKSPLPSGLELEAEAARKEGVVTQKPKYNA